MITFNVAIFAFAANCLVGLAFLLTWLSTKRTQTAAFYWSISHAALGCAAYLSFGSSPATITMTSLLASLLLGGSLATLAAGAVAMANIGFRARWVGLAAAGLTATLIVAGLIHPLAARGLALALVIAGNYWIGLFFWRRRIDHLVAVLLITKATLQLFDFGRIIRYNAGSNYSELGLILTLLGVFIALGLIRLIAVSSQLRFERVLGFVTNGVYARDEFGTLVFSNRAFARMLGYPEAVDIEGRNIAHLIPDTENNVELVEKMNRMMRGPARDEPIVTERPFRTRDGSVFDAEVTFQAFDESGRRLILAQVRDISEQRTVERQLRAQATIDEVTGLPNRRLVIDRIEHAIAECRRRSTGLAVLFLDLDHFKRINDSFGHRIGDQWLLEAGRRLKATLRDSDSVGRFGGDEFIVVLHDIDRERGVFYVEKVAARLLEVLQEPYTLGEFTTAINASIGIALYPQEGDDADLLIRRADTAMYEAKGGGRGRFSFFSDGMNERILDMLQIDSLLRQALEKNELFLQYQPIVTARAHKVRKVEALVRWKSAQLGAVSPARFIPVAEESALILEIGNWVLRQACADWAQWREHASAPPAISVNVSARQFADARFLETVAELIEQYSIPPKSVELELTERVLIQDDPKIKGALHDLSALGVSLSLDDFGTGYSSLSYLARFNLDTLKIDRSFIAQVDRLEHRKKLVQAIISMGHSLGMSVVAEGVEDHEQRVFLEDGQCDLMQGYLFGRPMSAEYLMRLLDVERGTAPQVVAG